MLAIRTAIVAPLVAAGLSAQMFEVYPSRPDVHWTTHTRLDLGSSPGEILMHVPASHFRGVGDRGLGTCNCQVFYRFEVRFWDGDRATREVFATRFYSVVAGQPGPPLHLGTASVTPLGVGPGLVAQTLFVIGPPPIVTMPCTDGFFLGVDVGAATYDDNGALVDGLEVLAAEYRPGLVPVPVRGDYPSNAAPSYAWSKKAGAFPWVNHPNGMALAFACDPRTPLLNLGNRPPKQLGGVEQSFGVGGMWSDVTAGRLDGLDVRVQDISRPNGFAWIILGPALPLPMPVPGIPGCLYVEPWIVLVAPLDANGHAQVPLLAQGAAFNATLLGKAFWAQALVADSTMTFLHFSNAQKGQF